MDADQRFVEVDGVDGRTRWRIDAGFVGSTWRCIWGDGCQGIHDERRPELHDGCCSVGVVLASEEEALNIAGLAASLTADQLEHFDEVQCSATGPVERAGPRWRTTVVDGACVLFNRPGFAGGTGCALHLAAVAAGDDPLTWKPQTCTRMPLRVEERRTADGVELTLRAWTRDDWGPGGRTMAWWCTEADEAFDGDERVLESMEHELRDALGDEVYDTLRDVMGPPAPDAR